MNNVRMVSCAQRALVCASLILSTFAGHRLWGQAPPRSQDFYNTGPGMAPVFSSPALPPATVSSPPMIGTSPALSNSPLLMPPPPSGVVPAAAQQPLVVPGQPLLPPPGQGGVVMPGPPMADYVRFMQEPRIRYTWLAGDGSQPMEMDINDIEGAVTFSYANFLFTEYPLLITPGFILHLWSGPTLPPLMGSMPARAYSGYVDFFWAPRLPMAPQIGAELDFRAGLYSDFESVTEEAFRPQGYGALVLQMSPALAAKGGVAYINRVDIKMLPVFGVVWTPDPRTRWDITFPNPKLASFLATVGCADLWWYVAGEYGGGSWEVDDVTSPVINGMGGQRVDINDIRAIVGLEWIGGYFGAKGFVEVGYVFERELVAAAAPGVTIELDPTIMLRSGISF